VLWCFSCRITHLQISFGEFAGRIRAAAAKTYNGAYAEVCGEREYGRYSILYASSCIATLAARGPNGVSPSRITPLEGATK
jgi:hypothetical protein